MKQFRLTSSAKIDLSEIWLFIAEGSEKVADKCLDELFSKFLLLAEHPFLGKHRNDLREGIRSFICGKLVIFYRDTESHLEIVRIIHGARDIDNLL